MSVYDKHIVCSELTPRCRNEIEFVADRMHRKGFAPEDIAKGILVTTGLSYLVRDPEPAPEPEPEPDFVVTIEQLPPRHTWTREEIDAAKANPLWLGR